MKTQVVDNKSYLRTTMVTLYLSLQVASGSLTRSVLWTTLGAGAPSSSRSSSTSREVSLGSRQRNWGGVLPGDL